MFPSVSRTVKSALAYPDSTVFLVELCTHVRAASMFSNSWLPPQLFVRNLAKMFRSLLTFSILLLFCFLKIVQGKADLVLENRCV